MIRIAVEGDREHTAVYSVVGAMDDYDPLIMGRTMKTDFTEAQAVVNGQTVEFDIYESRDFLTEFQRFTNCDAYIMVANPSHFSATDYANNLEQILKFENKTKDALPIFILGVGKEKNCDKIAKFAADHHIIFANVEQYYNKDEIRKIFVKVLEKVLPNLGTDRLTTRPPEKTSRPPMFMKPKHKDLPILTTAPADQKKKKSFDF